MEYLDIMLGIEGWEELFIEYQRDIIHIADTLSNNQHLKIVPPLNKVLDPFRMCPLSNVKLVILGQDPYKKGATGLPFSVDDGDNLTPSLKVICSWLGLSTMNGNLSRWAKQGVLLLNVIPTMDLDKYSPSHRTLWESFIRGCINICSRRPHIAFLVLGSVAEEYIDSIIDADERLVLVEKHPAFYARNNIYENKIYLFEEINRYIVAGHNHEIDFYNG